MADAPYAEVGALLRKAREARGKTQKQVADELEVTPPLISMWERGEKLPITADVRAVAKVYGVPPVNLLPRSARKAARAS